MKNSKKITSWLRWLGLLLLVFLLWNLDINRVLTILQNSQGPLIVVAIAFNLPIVMVKAFRWRLLMQSQHINYPFEKAVLAYFSGLYIGLLTPGRLGEFLKAFYVSRDKDVPIGKAVSSTLADRLFDLLALVTVGCLALIATVSLQSWQVWLSIMGVIAGGVAGLSLLITARGFGLVRHTAGTLLPKSFAVRLFEPGSLLTEMHAGLRQISPGTLLLSLGLTVGAYLIFFGQCYLLALALYLPIGFVDTSYTVSLGSLITLLPLSISGLGTREAVMIAYLGGLDVNPEAAFGFSLLVFVTFYLAGGLMGAVAWWIRPVPVEQLAMSRR